MKHALKFFFLFVFLTNLLFADSQLASYTYNLQKGWNLIGITLEPTEESKQELLAHDLYDFNGDSSVKAYCRSSDVSAGKAYWIYSEANESLAIKGVLAGNILPEEPGVQGNYLVAVGTLFQQTADNEVTITAPAKEGHSFANWTVDGVSIADTTQETVTFTMPSNNVLLGTNYSVNSYTLTVDGAPEQVAYGTAVSKTADAKEGHTFTNWTVTGVTVEDSTANPLEFTMPANDVTLVPNYSVNSYILTVDGVEEQVAYGTVVTKTADDKEEHTFTNWTVTGVSVEDTTANPLEFTMPASDVTLVSNYSVNNYTLTVDGVEKLVPYGEAVTVTAEEKEGKTFVRWWNITGVSVIENVQTVSFAMPANDVSMDSYYFDNGEYLVVNLETGEKRTSTTPPDLSADTCRTTELWLRRIPKGTFTMGSPEDEVGRFSDETQHEVTLTKDFYIGVFEMTQRQYELITGNKPSYFNNATYYATRPVEQVSYDMIRGTSAGAGWPANNNVDSDSFLGKLRTMTSLTFDLPTDAQWEYACRAGTTTSLNTGKNVVNPKREDANLNEAGRNSYNGGSPFSKTCDTTAGTAKVGSFLPNAWGLYDMHGNVWEWCLDWYQSSLGTSAVSDPTGGQSGSYRVRRGSSWGDSYPQLFRSAYRYFDFPSYGDKHFGFRVVCLP